MSSVGRIRIDDCSHDRTLLVELTIILLRRLRSCLEGRCWQLSRFFANANLPGMRFVKFSNATGSPSTNAMFGIETPMVGRPREAVLGLPSRNCTPRRGVGSAFRARRLMSLHPGLKHPTSQSLRRGRTFGVTHHNARGSIA